MALADIEADLTSGIPWRTCAVCHYLGERDAEWGARLRRMLANTGIKVKDIASKMEADADEPTIDVAALARHARGGCSAKERLR